MDANADILKSSENDGAIEMKIRLDQNGIRLFILGAICIYNTCTYLQIYNSFYLSAAVLCFLVFDSVNSTRVEKKFSNNSILCFFIALLVLASIMAFKGDFSRLINDISLIWGIFYSVICVRDVFNNYSHSQTEKFLVIQVLILVLSLVTTLLFLWKNPLAARSVGGVGSGDTSETMLKAQGCGGYGFVYGSVAIAYAYMVRVKNRIGNRPINYIFLTLFSYLVISANYTTAILLLLILGLYVFVIPENRRYTYFLFFIMIVALFLLSDAIIDGLYTITQKMGMTFVSDKLLSLIKASSITGYYQTMSRYNTFMISINSFLSNPIIGGSVASGHSVIFDFLADIGIFAIIVIMCIIQLFKSYLPHLGQKSVLGIFAIFFVVATFDTFFHPAQIVMTFILAPMLMKSQIQSN